MDASGQMALDEAFLGRWSPNSLVLRFFRWAGGTGASVPRAVTFGYFQNYAEVARTVRSRGLMGTFPMIRRLTGGGIVYHDGDITFSLVFPWSRLETPGWVYKNLHRGVHLGLKALGCRTRLWSGAPREPAAATTVCFAGPSLMDLTHEDGQKILGGALRRRGGAGLYQGSFRPEGFGARCSRDRLVQAVVEGIGLEWRTLFRNEEASEDALRAALRLRQRYESDEWNRRR
ncbi:MAG: lipoate--protein ligase family protein [Elusimicrobia bacterium]|nr:lipoate--protein ligase family protein [Elusimicrobiota bacterium]